MDFARFSVDQGMKEPNFFIIGAPKCGTTSLAAWLSGHPNIYIPPKTPASEPHYYSADLNIRRITTKKEYEGLFRKATANHIAVGEASTSYLFSRVAVPQIEVEHLKAKYIAMFRNPVDMAYSFHEEAVFIGGEHIHDFTIAWRLSPERRQARMAKRLCREPRWLDYQLVCRTGEQLQRLLDRVPRDRILLILLDELRENPRKIYLKVLDFLGVQDDGCTDFPVVNSAKERKWPYLRVATRLLGKFTSYSKNQLGLSSYKGFGIIKAIDSWNSRYRIRPPMPRELRSELMEYYRQDILLFARLTGEDTSRWLQ